MRFSGLLLFTFLSFSGYTQPYNRLIKWNIGYTRDHLNHVRLQNSINDTGAVKLDFLSWTPCVSYSHEFIFGKVISLSGTAGFQYMNLYYGSAHYGASVIYTTVNPHISIFYRKNFEYYMKLSVGASFYIHHPEVLPDDMRRFAPGRVNIVTGVTVGGFNFFLTDRLGLNLELSIWSVEMATFGLTYRFFRGEVPNLENNGEDTQEHLQDKIP